MPYVIRALNGPLASSVFAVSHRVIIGRDADADVQLVQKGVSRQHAAVFLDDSGEPHLMDLASTNGTFLDGESVGRVSLKPGSIFKIAESEFVFETSQGNAAAVQTAERLHLASGPAVGVTTSDQPIDFGALGVDPSKRSGK